MIRRIEVIRLFAACLALSCLTIAAWGQDLTAAITEHEEAVATARQKVIQAWNELIEQKLARNELADVGRYREYRQYFENESVIYLPDEGTPVLPAVRDYGADLKIAGDKLQSAYLAEIKRLTAAGQTEVATSLTIELTDRHLPNELVSIQPFRSKYHLNHWGLVLRVSPLKAPGERMNATFELTTGLSRGEFVSIRSINWPNNYVDHFGYRVRLTAARDDLAWKSHATWIKVPGLADNQKGVSFQSASHPDRYLRIRGNGEAWLDRFEENPQFRQQSTFNIKHPVFPFWDRTAAD